MITWEPKYSVGVTKFDEAHKKLIGLINDLYGAMKQGKGQSAVAATFVGLIDYTKVHFDDEIATMKACGYPDVINHARVHKDLVDQVLALQTRFQKGEALVALQVMDFLRGWLMNHIAGTDKKYTEHLNGKGVR